jgi:preprotein translocase subunit YajC
MEYFLTGIAGIVILLLILLLINNRKQRLKIKKNIQEINNLQTGSRDYQNFFE